jgi:hypothetical protein
MPAITSPVHFLSISGTFIIGRDTDKLFVYTFFLIAKKVLRWGGIFIYFCWWLLRTETWTNCVSWNHRVMLYIYITSGLASRLLLAHYRRAFSVQPKCSSPVARDIPTSQGHYVIVVSSLSPLLLWDVMYRRYHCHEIIVSNLNICCYDTL